MMASRNRGVPTGTAAFASGAMACFAIATWALVSGADDAFHPCHDCHDPLLSRDIGMWLVITSAMY
jgi:hypothetical protein